MVYSVNEINKKLKNEGIENMIVSAEAYHVSQFNELIGNINASHKDIGDFVGAIFVTGPSASGKTIFSNRLATLLKKEGYNASVISIDDYYRDRDEIHRMQIESGIVSPNATQFDYETIDAFDVQFFRTQMQQYLDCESIRLPLYNFNTGYREESNRILKREKNSVLIVEGIQAMNPALGGGLGFSKELNIYISPFNSYVNESGKVILDTKQVRFLRRGVRDIVQRGTHISKNIEMWKAVRAGEEKYIKPMKQYTDFFFNSSLEYEVMFYRSRMDEILENIDDNTREKLMAVVDIDVLRSFPAVRKIDAPDDSIFSEFYVG